ncbi:DNA-binding transcriptional regulator YiaG [Azospirillum fermentarium]|nr:DNA-binding transcriptional regulator YiaG [Azospirillum fermentarium]
MTPEAFKEARHTLGLSAQGMADALGVAEGRTVRRWEAGDRDIPGPAIALLRIWLDPRCPSWAKPWQTP